MDGYNYWSYQGPTNVDNNGLGVTYGTSPIECVTSSESGCFWGNGSSNSSPSNREKPGGAMISTSDPYKSGNMTLGVNYNSNDDTFSTGTFNMAAVTEYLYGPLSSVTSAVEFDQDFAINCKNANALRIFKCSIPQNELYDSTKRAVYSSTSRAN